MMKKIYIDEYCYMVPATSIIIAPHVSVLNFKVQITATFHLLLEEYSTVQKDIEALISCNGMSRFYWTLIAIYCVLGYLRVTEEKPSKDAW